MNCNILESLMLLLLLLVFLLRACCEVVVAGRHELRCLSIAYCPRIAQETTESWRVAEPQRSRNTYNNNNTSCKLMCRGGTKNTNQMQTHAAPKFTVTTTTNTTVESTQSWCLGDFYFYPKPPKLLMCTIFQRRSASTFKWQKWRDNNNNNTSDINNNCTMNLRIA